MFGLFSRKQTSDTKLKDVLERRLGEQERIIRAMDFRIAELHREVTVLQHQVSIPKITAGTVKSESVPGQSVQDVVKDVNEYITSVRYLTEIGPTRRGDSASLTSRALAVCRRFKVDAVKDGHLLTFPRWVLQKADALDAEMFALLKSGRPASEVSKMLCIPESTLFKRIQEAEFSRA